MFCCFRLDSDAQSLAHSLSPHHEVVFIIFVSTYHNSCQQNQKIQLKHSLNKIKALRRTSVEGVDKESFLCGKNLSNPISLLSRPLLTSFEPLLVSRHNAKSRQVDKREHSPFTISHLCPPPRATLMLRGSKSLASVSHRLADWSHYSH